jgi:hypothetical protein
MRHRCVDCDRSGRKALTDLTQHCGKALGQDHTASGTAPVVMGTFGSIVNVGTSFIIRLEIGMLVNGAAGYQQSKRVSADQLYCRTRKVSR